ncbi:MULTISPECIES: omptin family outer membrane protease [unclassified Endozoicomonas]|uniref:omptin family outer membrane protease n=1 Tax=unclassified Endozoicomonas TaxID=2644528 RepID=UPI00214896F4|nr:MULTISPECIES: omptin family outer membrane protease [unclassified Endozoicomonas]
MKKLILLPIFAVADTGAHAKVTLEGSLGVLNGEATELVYFGAEKVSQLDWKTDNAPVIKLGAIWDLNASWTFTANYWMTLTDGDGHMTDRDWDWESGISEPSHISKHPDTKTTKAFTIDLSASYWLLSQSHYKVGVTGGLLSQKTQYEARGGSYNYGFGQYVGTFPDDTLIISYEQKFSTLYLGLGGNYRRGKSEFGAQVKWSPLVKADDFDTHHLRNTTFKSEGDGNSTYTFLSLNYAYHLNPVMKIYGEYAYTKFSEKNMNVTINDGLDTYYVEDAGGAASESSVISIGLKYSF